MIELADFTRYLEDIRRRYDRSAALGGDRERGQLLAEEVLCEALRHMALTPETRAEVETLVQTFQTFSFASDGSAYSVPRSPTSSPSPRRSSS